MAFNSSTEIEHSFIEEVDEELGVTHYTCENCGSFYIEYQYFIMLVSNGNIIAGQISQKY